MGRARVINKIESKLETMPGKLSYFPLGGRAEAIRAMLAHKGVEFEDNRVGPEQLAEWKASGYSPMGGMPLWDEDGFVVCQSNAVLRMLAIRHGYYSEDPMIAYAIDSLMDFHEDIIGKFVGFCQPALGGAELGSGAVDKEAFLTGYWDKQIGVVQGRLAAHGKNFAAGTDRPTAADFKLAGQSALAFTDANPATPIPAELQAEIQAKIDAAPEYKAWLDRMKQENAAFYAKEQRPL